jgi:ComF family protein
MPAGVVPEAPCGACQHRPPPQTLAFVPFLYQDTIRALIVGVKFRGRLNLARLLGLCLAYSAREAGIARPDLIIPVPLHPRRLQIRGYNQALEMARALSKELAIPVDADTCVRLRAITPQEDLELEARRQNVRGAFGVIAPIRAEHVALLDDVVTTGSTASEVGNALLQAGARRVDLWAVARTPDWGGKLA